MIDDHPQHCSSLANRNAQSFRPFSSGYLSLRVIPFFVSYTAPIRIPTPTPPPLPLKLPNWNYLMPYAAFAL